MKDPLIKKYNVPGPRYTSYPTVPFWNMETFSTSKWMKEVEKRTQADPMLSLYIHLPFCEKLCTFCGCHKRITIRHDVEDPYIAYLHREWEQYLAVMSRDIVVSELHLGGGTPTFFHRLICLLCWKGFFSIRVSDFLNLPIIVLKAIPTIRIRSTWKHCTGMGFVG